MPMYEFSCTQCNKKFEELVFTSKDESDVTCPSCHSSKVKKQLSAFAVGSDGGSHSDFGGGGCASGMCPTGSCGL